MFASWRDTGSPRRLGAVSERHMPPGQAYIELCTRVQAACHSIRGIHMHAGHADHYSYVHSTLTDAH